MQRTRIVLAVGLALAIGCAVLVVVVPRIVKRRIVAAAAANGVALSIDDVSLAPGRARLRGVRATPLIQSDAKAAPAVSATADTVDVKLDGLTPTAVTVTGLRLVLDGSLDAVRAALAPREKGAPAASPLERVALEDASIKWTHALPTSRVAIDATHVKGDMTRGAGGVLGETWHLETPALRLFDATSTPWGASADGDAKGLRASVTLPKSAKLAFAVATNGARSIDVDTPDVVATDLGVPPAVLGLVGDETSHFELHVHHRETDASHASGTVVVAAKDVYLGPATHRISVALDAHYAGNPRASLAISQATLRAGPFTGPITGDFALDPARAHLRYTSGVMSCADAIKAQAAGYGDLGKGVAALAGMLGLDRAVEGRVSLAGTIDVAPNREPDVSFRTEGDCKLSYLPSQ